MSDIDDRDESEVLRDALRVLLADGYNAHEITAALLAEEGAAAISSVEAAVLEYQDASEEE